MAGPTGSSSRASRRSAELVSDFRENGGEIWLCGVCTRPRGITEGDLIEGAKIVGAARVIEEVVQGAKTITYA